MIDSDEMVFGLGAEVVGFTIAEYLPGQVLAIQRLVAGFPLL